MIVVAVTPVLHDIVPLQPLAVNVAEAPLHTVSVEVVTAKGIINTLGTLKIADLALSPQVFEQVAVYAPPSTVIEAVVAPVFHLIVPAQPDAVMVDLPSQGLVEVSEITGAFGGVPVPILIVFDAELSHSSTIHFRV